MPQIVHCKKAKPGTFKYVGRPTKYGNQWSHKEGTLAKFKVDSVEEAVLAHANWFYAPEQLAFRLQAIKDLKGWDLGCWGCRPFCHAMTYLTYVNGDNEFTTYLETRRSLDPTYSGTLDDAYTDLSKYNA